MGRATLRNMRHKIENKKSNQGASRQWSRREFISRTASCVATAALLPALSSCGEVDANETAPAAASQDDGYVTLYDMHAIAVYFDGGFGPETGTVTVAMIDANVPVNFVFWHGHDGVNHQFDLMPDHFQSIRDLKKTWVETTTVDGHSHKLFIDPSDPRWRVPGAEPVRIKRYRP